MEPTRCSETSANKHYTPSSNPKTIITHSDHGESSRSPMKRRFVKNEVISSRCTLAVMPLTACTSVSHPTHTHTHTQGPSTRCSSVLKASLVQSPLLGAIAKLRKAIISFVISPSVCLSVGNATTRFPLNAFTWYLSSFRKCFENNDYSTLRPMYICGISQNSS
jgi:hypothetical protein